MVLTSVDGGDVDGERLKEAFGEDFAHTALGWNDADLLIDLKRAEVRGAIIFQRYLRRNQFRYATSPAASLKIYSLKTHRYGLFSQIYGIVHSLLEASAHGYVLTWDEAEVAGDYLDPTRCPTRSFECYFLPITDVARVKNGTNEYYYVADLAGADGGRRVSVIPTAIKRDVRQSCVFENPPRVRLPEKAFLREIRDEIEGKSASSSRRGGEFTQDVVKLLRQKSGLTTTTAGRGGEKIFGPHFFVREAIRFVMRPNEDLVSFTRTLLSFGDAEKMWEESLRGERNRSFILRMST